MTFARIDSGQGGQQNILQISLHANGGGSRPIIWSNHPQATRNYKSVEFCISIFFAHVITCIFMFFKKTVKKSRIITIFAEKFGYFSYFRLTIRYNSSYNRIVFGHCSR